MSEPLLTPEDVAAYLNLSLDFVYERAAAGEIRCARLGSKLRFRAADVDSYVESCVGGRDACQVVPLRRSN